MKSIQDKLLEVLDKNKKELYSKFKINWQMKDKIHVKFGEGPFTVNKLIKNYGMDTSNLNLILFTYNNDVYFCRNGEFHQEVQFDNIYNIYYKYYFECLRKKCEFFILISIEKSAVNSDKESINVQDFLDSDNVYNTKFKIKYTPAKAPKVFLDNTYLSFCDYPYYYRNYWTLDSIINNVDKSGYYKPSFQQKLQDKLSLFKHNKVACYIKKHSQRDISTLQKSLENLKIEYSKVILTIDKADRLKALEKNVSLPYLYQYVENAQKYCSNTVDTCDEYHSYSDINNYLSHIKDIRLEIERGIRYIKYLNSLRA